MEALAVPFAAATVFTLGGYGIVRAQRYAQVVGLALGLLATVCLMLILVLLVVRYGADLCPPGGPACFAPGGAGAVDFTMVF